jgi:hypothetical protein
MFGPSFRIEQDAFGLYYVSFKNFTFDCRRYIVSYGDYFDWVYFECSLNSRKYEDAHDAVEYARECVKKRKLAQERARLHTRREIIWKEP